MTASNIQKSLIAAWKNCGGLEEIATNHPIMKLLAKPYLKSQQRKYMKDLDQKINE